MSIVGINRSKRLPLFESSISHRPSAARIKWPSISQSPAGAYFSDKQKFHDTRESSSARPASKTQCAYSPKRMPRLGAAGPISERLISTNKSPSPAQRATSIGEVMATGGGRA